MHRITHDVVALGELLIDFVQERDPKREGKTFRLHAGGAPANVAAAVARLGGASAFVGCVGDDSFGHELRDILAGYEVDTTGIQCTRDCKTTLAFVQVAEDGERSFQFYRQPGADTMLEWNETIGELIRHSRVFHFGSLSLTDEPARSATVRAVRTAADSSCLVTFDPNWRPMLWKDPDEARALILRMMELADVVKVSEEELHFLIGDGGDPESGNVERKAEELQERCGIPLLLVTRGRNGCHYRFGASSGDVPAFSVRAVDTTGAGDSFMGAFLYQLTLLLKPGEPMNRLQEEQLQQMLRFACAAAAFCTTRSGAMDALPALPDVLELFRNE